VISGTPTMSGGFGFQVGVREAVGGTANRLNYAEQNRRRAVQFFCSSNRSPL
jgi:hypothetical protein